LVKEGIDLNCAQIHFLILSDPEYKIQRQQEESKKDLPSFATGMPIDEVVEQFAKWGVDYYRIRRRKPVSKSTGTT
jgi:hypothetical protein